MAHILLVDDDEAFRSMLRRTLERGGHSVTEVGDGAQGMRALRATDHQPGIDLVITDIIMPNMEGIETIRALRQSYPHLQIIAMSGGGRVKPEGYLEVAKAFGAVRALSKPFESEELFAAIAAALG